MRVCVCTPPSFCRQVCPRAPRAHATRSPAADFPRVTLPAGTVARAGARINLGGGCASAAGAIACWSSSKGRCASPPPRPGRALAYSALALPGIAFARSIFCVPLGMTECFKHYVSSNHWIRAMCFAPLALAVYFCTGWHSIRQHTAILYLRYVDTTVKPTSSCAVTDNRLAVVESLDPRRSQESMTDRKRQETNRSLRLISPGLFHTSPRQTRVKSRGR